LAVLFGVKPAYKQASEYVHLQGIEDVDKVQAYLMGVEGRNAIEEKGEQGETALLAGRGRGRGRPKRSGGSCAGEVPGTDGRLCRGVQCYKCDRVGHYQDQCPSREAGDVQAATNLAIVPDLMPPGIYGL